MNTAKPEARPKRRALRALAVLATIAGGLWLGLLVSQSTRTDRFEGKTVARLIRDMEKTESGFDRAQQKAWAALPEVLKNAFSEHAPLPASMTRTLAALELKRRAPRATEAVTGLADLLDRASDSIRKTALPTLALYGRAGRAAVPAVLRTFDAAATNLPLRIEAARTLVALAPDSAEVHARLLDSLRTLNERAAAAAGEDRTSAEATRTILVTLLGKLTKPGDAVVEVLLEELNRADDALGVEVINAIEKAAPGNPSLVPALAQKLRAVSALSSRPDTGKDGSSPPLAIRGALLNSLQRLARENNEVVPLLLEMLKTADASLTPEIIRTLGNIRPTSPEVLPALIGMVKREDWSMRLPAVNALARMGPDAAPAIPALIEALREAVRDVSKHPSQMDFRAAQPYVRFAPASVRPRLGNAAPAQRKGATTWQSWPLPPGPPVMTMVRALGQIGPPASAALPDLLNVLSLTSPTNKFAPDLLRYETGLALWRIDRDGVPGRAILREALRIPSLEFAPEFLSRLISNFEEMDRRDVLLLIEAADHIDEVVRASAIGTLGNLGVEAGDAVSVLRRIAQDRLDPARSLAERSLRQIESALVD